jgi:hypothetical protein
MAPRDSPTARDTLRDSVNLVIPGPARFIGPEPGICFYPEPKNAHGEAFIVRKAHATKADSGFRLWRPRNDGAEDLSHSTHSHSRFS